MIRKADIDHIPAVADRLIRKGTGKFPELFQRRNSQNNVIPHPDMIQSFVHGRNSAADFLKCGHNKPPFSAHSALNYAGKPKKASEGCTP